MSSKFRIEMNKAGLRELFTSSGVVSLVTQATGRVQSAAGEGYEMEILDNGKRPRGIVRAATPHAYYSNRKHHTLQRAIGGG